MSWGFQVVSSCCRRFRPSRGFAHLCTSRVLRNLTRVAASVLKRHGYEAMRAHFKCCVLQSGSVFFVFFVFLIFVLLLEQLGHRSSAHLEFRASCQLGRGGVAVAVEEHSVWATNCP